MSDESPAATFKDRRAGLIVFGVLTVLLGLLCALFVPLMGYGAALSGESPGGSGTLRMVLPSMATYGGLAVALIWLGVGSILCRRWARALLLIFAWMWFVIGVIGMVFCTLVLPATMASTGNSQMPAAVQTTVMIFLLIFFGVFFILLPLCWIFFYRSLHTKATCEAYRPESSWTDRCPLPVLALSMAMAVGTPMLLLSPLMNKGIFPFFGILLSGWIGGTVYVLLAMGWAYAAWASYRIDIRGWWVALAIMSVIGISGGITYAIHDTVEVYQKMGFPSDQIATVQKMAWLRGHGLAWITVGSCALWAGFILYTRRYFRRPNGFSPEIRP